MKWWVEWSGVEWSGVIYTRLLRRLRGVAGILDRMDGIDNFGIAHSRRLWHYAKRLCTDMYV